MQAFEDTWTWDDIAKRAHEEIIVGPNHRVFLAMQAFYTFLGTSDMMAYLAMMAPRLIELRRVMKPTASIYLHCDPTASHYLKMLMDGIFGPENYRNEISWQRFSAKNDSLRFGRCHDVILFYTKSKTFTWNTLYTDFTDESVNHNYTMIESSTGRRYRHGDLTAAKPGGDVDYEWHGVKPYKVGHWAYSREKMDKMFDEGRIEFRRTGMPVFKRYLDEQPGVALQDIWTDIRLSTASPERLGYPTQKPEALLERILKSSSNEGDTVLDPFCGCGTTVSVAQRLNRRWFGIDITHLAITLIKSRLTGAYGDHIKATYKVVGEPASADDAAKLAVEDPYQFQWWSLGLVGARPVDKKKGADKGIDGRLFFNDGNTPKPRQIIFSVKAGGTGVAHVRDLRGVIEREKAEIGVLITMESPTKPMKTEALEAGYYTHDMDGTKYPRLQLLTVKEIMDGKAIKYPPWAANTTFKQAVKAKPTPKHKDMMFDFPDDPE